MTITILLVPANLKVRKEALNSFIERHAMLSEFVPLEVILEIRWSKPMPIDHGSSYRAATFPGFAVGPTSGISRSAHSIPALSAACHVRQHVDQVTTMAFLFRDRLVAVAR